MPWFDYEALLTDGTPLTFLLVTNMWAKQWPIPQFSWKSSCPDSGHTDLDSVQLFLALTLFLKKKLLFLKRSQLTWIKIPTTLFFLHWFFFFLVHEWWVEYIYVEFAFIRKWGNLLMDTTNWQWLYLNMNCVDISRALICSYTSRPSHPCSPIYNNITLGYLILPSQLLISAVTKLIELTENSVLHCLFSGHPLAGIHVNNIIICLSTSETKNYV